MNVTRKNKIRFNTKWVVIILIVFFACTVFLLINKPSKSKKPLYWVAPMDSNFRRDGPGKSPMGMDLVPVYEEDLAGGGSDNPGAVFISPAVQNQLGVRTSKVKKGRIEPTLTSYGRVTFDDSEKEVISSRVAGRINLLVFNTEGEKVRRGQTLYSIYSEELIAAQEQFLAARASGNQFAQINTEEKLRTLGADTTAINTLRRDGAVQQNVLVTSPIEGVISKLEVVEGSVVNPGQPLLTINSLDSLWLILEIPESQASLISEGQILTLNSPQYPEEHWQSQIDFIYPTIDNLSQTVRFRATLDNNNQQFKPNMYISAEVSLAPRQQSLLVPHQAIIRLGKQNRAVVALGDGLFKSVQVTLGQTDGKHVEIIDGLQENDDIVISAQFLIDSESSKTSDFLRMAPLEVKVREAWTNAVIEEIFLQENKLRISHEPIEEWNMAAMTMNFLVEANFDISRLNVGDRIKARIIDKPDAPLYIITEMQTLEVDK